MEKQVKKDIIKSMLFDSAFIGSLLTCVLILFITPMNYEHVIFSYGHFTFIIILSLISYYKFYEIKKEWKRINI